MHQPPLYHARVSSFLFKCQCLHPLPIKQDFPCVSDHCERLHKVSISSIAWCALAGLFCKVSCEMFKNRLWQAIHITFRVTMAIGIITQKACHKYHHRAGHELTFSVPDRNVMRMAFPTDDRSMSCILHLASEPTASWNSQFPVRYDMSRPFDRGNIARPIDIWLILIIRHWQPPRFSEDMFIYACGPGILSRGCVSFTSRPYDAITCERIDPVLPN